MSDGLPPRGVPIEAPSCPAWSPRKRAIIVPAASCAQRPGTSDTVLRRHEVLTSPRHHHRHRQIHRPSAAHRTSRRRERVSAENEPSQRVHQCVKVRQCAICVCVPTRLRFARRNYVARQSTGALTHAHRTNGRPCRAPRPSNRTLRCAQYAHTPTDCSSWTIGLKFDDRQLFYCAPITVQHSVVVFHRARRRASKAPISATHQQQLFTDDASARDG